MVSVLEDPKAREGEACIVKCSRTTQTNLEAFELYHKSNRKPLKILRKEYDEN